jgi:hypothetical protein
MPPDRTGSRDASLSLHNEPGAPTEQPCFLRAGQLLAARDGGQLGTILMGHGHARDKVQPRCPAGHDVHLEPADADNPGYASAAPSI